MNLLSSLIRTYVPMLVALLVGWLTSLGVTIDDDQKAALVGLISTVAGALYYLLARLLEKQFPWATVLLGSSKQPVAYAPAAPVITSPEQQMAGLSQYIGSTYDANADPAGDDQPGRHEAPEA